MKKNADVLNPELNKTPEAYSPTEDRLAIIQSIIAEWDAIHLYQAAAEATQNSTVKELMLHLVEEELKHVGELEQILSSLDETTEEVIDEGKKEFEKRTQKADKETDKGD